MDERSRRKITNNRYLTDLKPARPVRLTLGSEFKRLCSKPLRLLASLVLVVLPLLVALAGALDLLSAWLYTTAHHAAADSRQMISIFSCLTEQAIGICRGLVWASPASPKRIVLYPWHDAEPLNRLEPHLFLAYFVLAVLAFAAIGNPNALRMLHTLRMVTGVEKLSAKQKGAVKDKESLEYWMKKLLTGKIRDTDLEIEVFSSKEIELVLDKARTKIKEGGKQAKPVKSQLLPPGPDHSLNVNALLSREDTDAGLTPQAWLDLDQPEEFWKNHWLLGSYLPRDWESNPGYFWYDRTARPVPYWLSLSALRTGLVIVAPPGSGKTASIFKPLRNFLVRSGAVGIFYDVKSSENSDGSGTDFPPDLFKLNFDAAIVTTRGSFKLNVFAGQTPAQAGERLAEALIPDLGGDKAYFSNNAKSAMASIVAAFHACYEVYPTLVEILSFLSSPDKLEALSKLVVEELTGPRYQEGVRLSTLLHRVKSLSGNKATDTLGNLATALEPLVTDVAAQLLVTNPGPDTFTVEELLKEAGLVRFALPVANNPRIYPIIGRLVLAQFTYAVLSPASKRNLFKMIAVDEARFFITDNVANGMAQARSNNAGFALSFQTLTQIRDGTLLDNIFASAGTKLVMGKVSDKDAERYSKLFGTIELPYLSYNTNESQSHNKNSGSSYSRGSEFEFFSGGETGREARTSRATSSGKGSSTAQSYGVNFNTRSRRRFLDSEVRELEQRHAIIESSNDQGKQWFAQVINMDAAIVQKLEQQVNNLITDLLKKSGRSKDTSKLLQSGKGQVQNSAESEIDLGTSLSLQKETEAQLFNSNTRPDQGNSDMPVGHSWDVTQSNGRTRPRIRIRIIPTALPATPTSSVVSPVIPPELNQAGTTSVTGAITPTPAVSRELSEEASTGGTVNSNAEPDPEEAANEIDKANLEPVRQIVEIATELEKIKSYLLSLDVPPDQAETIAQLVLTSQRTLADLERLAGYARSKSSLGQAGSYVVAMVKKNKYPAAKKGGNENV